MYQYSEVVQTELQRNISISCSIIVYDVYTINSSLDDY